MTMLLNRTFLPLWIASLLLLLAALVFWMSSDSAAPDLARIPATPSASSDAALQEFDSVPSPIAAESDPTPTPAPPAPTPTPPQRVVRTSELVTEYLLIENVSERGDLARSIASMDDAESLRELTTLFRRARHPAEREGLIAALGDTDFTTELDGKLALLTTALGSQPRNVRDAALGVVAQIEDPRAIALIKKVAASDPDHEVREAAKALLADE